MSTGSPDPKDLTKGYSEGRDKPMRTIPLELFYKKDGEPTYGITADDDGRFVYIALVWTFLP